MKINQLKIIGASFGNPDSDKTYSGVPRQLFDSMENICASLVRLNSRKIKWWDIFEGAVDFSKTFEFGRPGLNANWTWKNSTIKKIGKRFESVLRRYPQYDCVFEIGTHILLDVPGIKHYSRTDMTIIQAYDNKQFGVSRISRKNLKEAIESQKQIFDNCEKIFVASSWVKGSIVNDYAVESKKVVVVGEGASLPLNVDIDDKAYSPDILFVGREWHRKGGDYLMDAFKIIKEKIPNATLTIIGLEPPRKLQGMNILGYLNKKNPNQKHLLEDAYKKSSILCVPSIFEPFGLCFLEAQLYGLVPVSFEGQGRSEAIKDGKTGILVEEKNPEALADAIINLLKDPAHMKKMGTAANEHIINNFTWQRVAEKIITEINKI